MSTAQSTSTTSKVSFIVRQPTPVSRQGSSGLDSDAEGGPFKVPALPKRLTESGRSTPASPLANAKSSTRFQASAEDADSSDEEREDVDEIVTGFDQFGVQRLYENPKKEGPLVIPALANRDWREIARKRKAAEMFVPAGGAAKVGADGSIGGLGTRDAINAGPQVAGLVKMEKRTRSSVDEDGETMADAAATSESIEVHQETEDEKAMRSLIAQSKGETDPDNELAIDAIPVGMNDWTRPADETDAFKKDVVTRPEQATLEDYERVPVDQFGAALLRGMGWKPGQAASRTRTGPVEPYLPTARPALLGIGAKEREVLDDGSKSKKPTRPERRYIPVVKKEREGGARHSAPASRRSSRSPEPDRMKESRSDRERDRGHGRTHDRRDRDYDYDRNGRRSDGDYKRGDRDREGDEERRRNDSRRRDRRR